MDNKIIKYVAILLVSFLLTACGSVGTKGDFVMVTRSEGGGVYGYLSGNVGHYKVTIVGNPEGLEVTCKDSIGSCKFNYKSPEVSKPNEPK